MYLPNCHCAMNLVTDIDDRRYQMLLCDENVEIRDAFKHGLSRRNSLETKCLNWTRLCYRGNTSSKILPRWDECLPWFYLGKDEVIDVIDAWRPRGKNAANGSILSGSTVAFDIFVYYFSITASGMQQ